MEESRMGEDGDKVFFGGEHLVHCFSFDWSTGWARDKARYVETDWKMRGWNQFIWIWSRCLFVTSSLRFAQTVPPSDKEPPAHPGGVSLPLTPLYWLLVGFYCGFLFFCSFDSIPFRFILSNYCCPILLAVEWWVVFFYRFLVCHSCKLDPPDSTPNSSHFAHLYYWTCSNFR